MNLGEVSCPFTWGMEEVSTYLECHLISLQKEYKHDAIEAVEDEFPESMLVFHLMMVYEQVLSNELSSAKATLEEAQKSLDLIMEDESTSENMKNGLKHIFVGTKCNVYKKLNRSGDIKMLLEEIRSTKDMTKKELAVVYICQSTAYSLYDHIFIEKAISYAMKAIEYEPDNGKWHFLLGKLIRKQRRKLNFFKATPDPKEKKAFEKAWELSQSPLIGVSLAQMYREGRDYEKATDVYMRVFESNPTSCKVRLQLALGFIRARQPTHAKSCLDYVAERMPNLSSYLHYMAIYHQRCTQDMKTACSFFQRAVEPENYSAEMAYVECRKIVDRDFDPLPYLLSLLKKYANKPDNVLQEINTAIGSCYLFQKNDIVSACKYYMESMKIDPKSRILTIHSFMVPGKAPINIYEVLMRKVESASQNSPGKYDSNQLVLFHGIREMCLKHGPKPAESNRSITQGSWRNGQSGSRSADISQTGWRSKKGATGNWSTDELSKTDVLADEFSRMGFAHRRKQSK